MVLIVVGTLNYTDIKMKKVYTYKKQGDGRDSWRCEEIENGKVLNIYMVFEDPFKENSIDINSLPDEQILKLKARFEAL